VLVAYRLHAGNLHVRRTREIADEARRLDAKHARSPLPGRLDPVALDGWMAWSYGDAGRHWAAAAHFARATVRAPRPGHVRGLASEILRATGLRRPPPATTLAPAWLAGPDHGNRAWRGG